MYKTTYKKNTGVVLRILDAIGRMDLKDFGIEVPQIHGINAHAVIEDSNYSPTSVRTFSNLYYAAQKELCEAKDSEENPDQEDLIGYYNGIKTFSALWDFWEKAVEICQQEDKMYYPSPDAEGIDIRPLKLFLHKTTWDIYKDAVLDSARDDDSAVKMFLCFRHYEWGWLDVNLKFIDLWNRYRDAERDDLTANFLVRPFTRPFSSVDLIG